MAVPREPPSPVVPIVVLVIVGMMMTFPSLMAYDADSYWASTMEQVQTHFVLGAFLIPVCLLLAVQAFGLPQVNRPDPPGRSTPPSPYVQSINQNLTTSILLGVVIFTLLMFMLK